eukprot:TRINITY_DN6412_c2_g1_i4.p1 TRINITY_DN6412_c2_g1~~TRINITY_DN6412_c2_g1_i4.p1  ORF type:complete len:391 (-),score=26.49 TRINITY_DN6412_c2_g1_i4:80-1201(-)
MQNDTQFSYEPIVLSESQQISLEWVESLKQILLNSTKKGPKSLSLVLPFETLQVIINRVTELVSAESTLVEVKIEDEEKDIVTVVGDTHGQFHDVCHMFECSSLPSRRNHYVFNGDYVDRGCWGVELLTLLLCYKLALPDKFTILRGNHESRTCTTFYGFKGELKAKYQGRESNVLYKLFLKLFANLPLAALVNEQAVVLHGGLFRKPIFRLKPKGVQQGKKRRKFAVPFQRKRELGTLEDLRKSIKGGLDPSGRGQTQLATDVLWSDPMSDPGMQNNDSRGVGVLFGPDITQEFLSTNNLKLIIRSHEGPDARYDRPDLQSLHNGWTEDHVTQAGKLITLFSAPDYPQFQDTANERRQNKGAKPLKCRRQNT